ncbi:alpha/beta fold hydrolase [Streptomyces sp. MUSC 14]|uniref:alpha/beta fold hydrolase n=1 Tax=Streptomyces sp. MUSC 14 TaxID=1354889 RepID=UPI0011608A72|nr:alpha/beta hydrolase [Streptomyces sp. MUSC 14]
MPKVSWNRLDPRVAAPGPVWVPWPTTTADGGDSTSVPGPYDLEQLADDAQRVIDVLGCSSHVLVAHSMGGTVAQMPAARRPEGPRL